MKTETICLRDGINVSGPVVEVGEFDGVDTVCLVCLLGCYANAPARDLD